MFLIHLKICRMKNADDLLLTSNEVKEVAIRIEEALFRQCRQTTGSRYKNWCKAFLTHIKDTQNQVGRFSFSSHFIYLFLKFPIMFLESVMRMLQL